MLSCGALTAKIVLTFESEYELLIFDQYFSVVQRFFFFHISPVEMFYKCCRISAFGLILDDKRLTIAKDDKLKS